MRSLHDTNRRAERRQPRAAPAAGTTRVRAAAARGAAEALEGRRLLSAVSFAVGRTVDVDYSSAGGGPQPFAVADFDRDGRDDLLAPGRAVLLSRPDGTFSTALDVSSADPATSSVVSGAAADLDGDGNPDVVEALAVAAVSDGPNVYVLRAWLGRGDGTFADPVDSAPRADGFYGDGGLVVADLTGDGRADIVTTGYLDGATASGVELFAGAGDGMFAFADHAGLSVDGSDLTPSLAAADVDGDGRADVVAAFGGDDFAGRAGGVAVFAVGADGTLGAPAIRQLPDLPADAGGPVAVGDFDADGHPDLALTRTSYAVSEGGLVLVRGGPGGTWTVDTTYAGNRALYVAAADVDGDGTVDLAAVDSGGVEVLAGRGDGSFAEPPGAYAAAEPGAAAAVGDFDGDGRADLAVPGRSRTTVLAGDGRGGFDGARRYRAEADLPVQWADVDGDGRRDLLTQDFSGDTLVVRARLTQPDGSLGPPVETPTPGAAANSGTLTTGDFDGDGRADLAYVTAQTGDPDVDAARPGLEVSLANGDGTFAGPVGYLVGRTLAAPTAVDLTGDGRDDLVVLDTSFATPDDARGLALVAAAGGTFDEAGAGTFATTDRGLYAPLVGDFDGDGRADLVLGGDQTGTGEPTSRLYPGRGDGTLAAAVPVRAFDASQQSASAGDFDGDGRADLVIGGGGPTLLGRRDGAFAVAPGVPAGQTSTAVDAPTVAAADLDGDGRDDVVVVGFDGAAVYRSAGDGTFVAGGVVTLRADGSRASVQAGVLAIGDVNGDGRPDLALTESGGFNAGAVTVLLNTTPADAAPAVRPGTVRLAADAGFGTGGTAAAPFVGPRADAAAAAVVQPDGKVVLAGGSGGDGLDYALARLNPDGSPDPTFGDGGRVRTPPPPGRFGASFTALALQPDGKILAVGPGRLARYLPDGSPDPSFGVDGSAAGASGAAVAVGPDGSVVVADAFTYDEGYAVATAARYGADGTLDEAFDDGNFGVGVELFLGFGTVTAGGVSVRPDGKVVLAASVSEHHDDGTVFPTTAVFRLDADGTPDPRFGDGGRVNLAGVGDARIAVRPGGKVVVAGTRPEHALRVVRLRQNGSFDPSFAAGAATVPVAPGTLVRGVASEPGGGVVVATIIGGPDYPFSPPAGDSRLLRFDRRGAVDAGFAARAGMAGLNVAAVAVRPGGGVVAAGTTLGAATAVGAAPADFLAAAYAADGTPDPAFGGGRPVALDFASPRATFAAFAAALPDGRIVTVGGFEDPTTGGGAVLSRFAADGTLDPTFGAGGTAVLAYGAGDLPFTAAAAQADGKVVLGGQIQLGAADPERAVSGFVQARVNADGTPDATFGDGGRVVTPLPAARSFDWAVRAIAVLPGGDLLAAGSSWVARYHADGTPDASFGDGGVLGVGVDATADPDGRFVTARSLAPLPDGRFLVAGSGRFGITVARFDAAGRIDPSFGDGGFVEQGGSTPFTFEPAALAVRPDGKLLVAAAGDRSAVLFRLDADGTPDAAFGQGGVATAAVEAAAALSPLAAFAEPDGGTVLAFHATAEQTYARPAGRAVFVRFTPEGVVDETFGVGGRAVALDPAVAPNAGAVLRTADGAFLLAGGATGSGALVKVRPVDVPAPPAPALDGRTLRVAGTAGDDVVHVGRFGDALVVTVNGVVSRFDPSAVERLVVAGGEGDDSLVVGPDVQQPRELEGGPGRDLFVDGAGAGAGVTTLADFRPGEDAVPARRA